MGLENIHSLSKQGQYILQVELTDWAGQQLPVARYRFQLDGVEKKFTLHLEDESSSGVQEKIMSTGASGLPFSTADRDNDLAADVNCAELLSGTTSLAPKPQHMQTKLSGWVHTSKKIEIKLKVLGCLFTKMLFCCRWLVVQRLWRVEPQWQISQRAKRTQATKTRDVLDVLKGTKLLCEDYSAKDRTRHNKATSRCLMLEHQRQHLLA